MKRGKRFAAGALCCVLLLTAQSGTLYAADDFVAAKPEGGASSSESESETKPSSSSQDASYKGEIDDLNSRIQALKAEQQKIQNDINKTASEKAQKTKEREALQNQIYLAQQEIELLSGRISTLEHNIDQKEREIVAKQAEIDENYDLYLERLRAMYMKEQASPLGVVLGASSYSDLLVGAEMTRRVSVSDQELIERLVSAKRDIEQALREIEENKAQVEQDKSDVASQKQNLDVKREAVAQQEQSLSQLQKEFEAQKAQKLKEEKEAQAEIDRIYAENASIGDYVGGDFLWPVSGFTTITSSFGWRWGKSDYHTGVDIAGRNRAGKAIFRQPIKAANAGRVIYASNQYTPGRSYGKYIIVDHGGGMSTLYGHSDEVIVSKGDDVEQGQTLGYVGTTGWSTGPHLHFEIRENGVAKNPMSWFS